MIPSLFFFMPSSFLSSLLPSPLSMLLVFLLLCNRCTKVYGGGGGGSVAYLYQPKPNNKKNTQKELLSISPPCLCSCSHRHHQLDQLPASINGTGKNRKSFQKGTKRIRSHNSSKIIQVEYVGSTFQREVNGRNAYDIPCCIPPKN